MRAVALHAPRVFDGERLRGPGGLVAREGRITAVFDGEPPSELAAALPLHRCRGLLAPGYVDLQANGGGGVLFNEEPNVAGLEAIARAHRTTGTTSLLPTLISPSADLLRAGLTAISNSIEELRSKRLRTLGIHVEGPYLNPGRAGAHDPSSIRALDADDLALLCSASPYTTLVTLAPECVDLAAIRALSDAGVQVYAGHSEADAETFRAAVHAGLRGATHLFNAMPPARNRDPGLVGAVLAHSSARAGVIADGVHVDWTSFRGALAALGPDRLHFVSDAMPPLGADPVEPGAAAFSLGGAPVWVRGEGDARHCALRDGTLAGSCLSVAGAVRNAIHEAGVAPTDALRMGTASPADAIGRADEVGRLREGAWADLIELSSDYEVESIWVAGEAVDRGAD